MAQRMDRDMTKLLEQVIASAQRLSEREQNAIAALILDELDDDALWDRALAASPDALAKLAAEDSVGKTVALDPQIAALFPPVATALQALHMKPDE